MSKINKVLLKIVKGFARANPFSYLCHIKLKIKQYYYMENGILTAKEIKEGNLLIANFDKRKIVLDASEINYHLDFFKIMSVVEKITKLKINGYTPFVNITNFGCKIEINNLLFRGVHGHDFITDIWAMVVNFLEWYELTYKN